MAEAKHPVEPEHAAAAEEPNVPAAEVQQHRVSNSAHKAEHEPAEAPTNAPRKSEGGVTAAPAAAAVPAPAVVKKAPVASKPQEDEQQPAKVASPRHKETAVERLTTPTAMRMLKTLEQTQGGKAEWHIATGVPFKSKRLGPDEMSAMVDRLCTPKHAEDNMPPKLHAVKLTFEGNKEVLVPVKESTKEENVQYMASLYDRCQETRAKTKQTLEEKWLQPLIKPKQAAAK